LAERHVDQLRRRNYGVQKPAGVNFPNFQIPRSGARQYTRSIAADNRLLDGTIENCQPIQPRHVMQQ
jgi:hypothetical protein